MKKIPTALTVGIFCVSESRLLAEAWEREWVMPLPSPMT